MTSSPQHPEGPPHLLSAINPSAGQHPIPAREADLARALRCATSAWSRFPYLAMRYGERGRQFTNRDSCWLVSLYDLEDVLVIANLRWHAATGLRAMLEQLRAQRCALLDQHRHDALVTQWQSRFAACSGRRVRDAAALQFLLAWTPCLASNALGG